MSQTYGRRMIETVVAAKLIVVALGKTSVVCKITSGVLGPSIKTIGLLPIISRERYERDRTERPASRSARVS